MNFDEIAARLRTCLIEAEAAGLPRRDVESVDDLVTHREYGIAMEILCEQLYEYSIPVISTLRHGLAEIGAAMGIEPSNWTDLEELDPARPVTDEAENADGTSP